MLKLDFPKDVASFGESTRPGYRRKGCSNQRGSVLLIVLWVLLAMSVLALSFSASIRTEVDAARNVVDQRQAYYMARAGIEYAIHRILQAQSAFFQENALALDTDAVPQVFSGVVSLGLADGRAEVDVIDETGKLNLNLAPDHLIYNLLIMVGVQGELADVITDSISDWRDSDQLVRQFGAEDDYYLSLDEPYRAKNGFFDVPEELLLIRGVTPEIYYGRKGTNDAGEPVEYYGLQHYFTTYSNVARININSAPIPVLAAIPGLDYATAAEIVRMRQQSPISDVSQVAQLIPGLSGEVFNYLSVFRSQVYTLTGIGEVRHSGVISKIRAVVRVDGASRQGYAILYWNEANTEL